MSWRGPTILALRLLRRGPLALLAVMSFAPSVGAQDKDDDDLEVTMQVLDDPEPKQPNEVLQRIPLPKPSSDTAATAREKDKAKDKDAPKEHDAAKDQDTNKNDNTDKSDSNDRRRDTDQGRDASDSAKERAKEAQEQRNEARREENRREHDDTPGKPPKDHPGRPRG